MKAETKEKIKADLDKKLLSGREYEYVVSFRHRFLTYGALPLFLLFIGICLAISWTVRVPEQLNEPVKLNYSTSASKWQISGLNVIPDELKSDLTMISVSYLLMPDGERVDFQLSANQYFLTPTFESIPADWVKENEMDATLVLTVKRERFLFKLLDELARSMQIKRPPSEEAGP